MGSPAACANQAAQAVRRVLDRPRCRMDVNAGTTSVNVHDLAGVPADGLHYAVFLPVNLGAYRHPCGKGPVYAGGFAPSSRGTLLRRRVIRTIDRPGATGKRRSSTSRPAHTSMDRSRISARLATFPSPMSTPTARQTVRRSIPASCAPTARSAAASSSLDTCRIRRRG